MNESEVRHLIFYTRLIVRQLYKNISMLFLFPVKYGKLSAGVNAQCSYHVTVSHQ